MRPTFISLRVAPLECGDPAASANYWDRGVDGLYAWFMRWPLGDPQRRALAQQELVIAQRLSRVTYGQSRLETDRQERLALAALRACRLL